MSEGPWGSGTGNSAAPAPSMPGSGGSSVGSGAAAEDTGPAPARPDDAPAAADAAGASGRADPASPASPASELPADPAYPAYPAYPTYSSYSAYPADPASDPDYSLDGPGDTDEDGDQSRWRLGRWRPQRWRLDRRGRRLAAAGLAIALTSALVGGLLGGYIATRSQSTGTAPGYSLGLAPRAVTGRPSTSIAGVAARVLPSVVMIRVNGGDGTGSGFVIQGGYIITNNHVVTLDGHTSDASIQVVLRNGVTVPGRLVGRDTYSDIAVIRPVGASGLPALSLGNSSGVAVGDPVIAFGAPLGLAGTVTSGIVSALDRPVQPGAGNGPDAPQVFLEAIQTDAPINPGNSGGPLVNGRGQVIGVNAAFDTLGGNVITGQGGNIGLGFAIPINQVRRIAMELIRTGHATHAVIGALLNTKYSGSGAQIAAAVAGASAPVTPGGPAARAGLRPGDVIMSLGGQPVTNSQTLLDAIRAEAPGIRVHLTYVRRGTSYRVVLRLGSAP